MQLQRLAAIRSLALRSRGPFRSFAPADPAGRRLEAERSPGSGEVAVTAGSTRWHVSTPFPHRKNSPAVDRSRRGAHALHRTRALWPRSTGDAPLPATNLR